MGKMNITRPQWVAMGEAIHGGAFVVGEDRFRHSRRLVMAALQRRGLLDAGGRITDEGRAAWAAVPPKVRSGRTGRNGSYLWPRCCARR
jgi:hypothetical protein